MLLIPFSFLCLNFLWHTHTHARTCTFPRSYFTWDTQSRAVTFRFQVLFKYWIIKAAIYFFLKGACAALLGKHNLLFSCKCEKRLEWMNQKKYSNYSKSHLRIKLKFRKLFTDIKQSKYVGFGQCLHACVSVCGCVHESPCTQKCVTQHYRQASPFAGPHSPSIKLTSYGHSWTFFDLLHDIISCWKKVEACFYGQWVWWKRICGLKLNIGL